MPDNPKFSVIIPAYNAQDSIGRCIASLLAQKMGDFEVIVINDGSVDDTESIVAGFTDDRIRLITTQNAGPGKARNLGLELAKGEWIFCLDADDFVDPGLFDQVSAAITDKVDVVLLNFATYNEKCKTKFPAEWSYRNTNLFPDNAKTVFTSSAGEKSFFETIQSIPWNKVVRKKIIDDNNIRFSEIHLSEDMMFSFPACILAEGIVRLREPLVFHSEYSGTSAMDKKNEYPLDFLQALAELKGFLIKNDVLERYRGAFLSWTYRSLSYNIFEHNDAYARAIQIDECIQVFPELIDKDFDSIQFLEPTNQKARRTKQCLISPFAKTKVGFYTLDKMAHATRHLKDIIRNF